MGDPLLKPPSYFYRPFELSRENRIFFPQPKKKNQKTKKISFSPNLLHIDGLKYPRRIVNNVWREP